MGAGARQALVPLLLGTSTPRCPCPSLSVPRALPNTSANSPHNKVASQRARLPRRPAPRARAERATFAVSGCSRGRRAGSAIWRPLAKPIVSLASVASSATTMLREAPLREARTRNLELSSPMPQSSGLWRLVAACPQALCAPRPPRCAPRLGHRKRTQLHAKTKRDDTQSGRLAGVRASS